MRIMFSCRPRGSWQPSAPQVGGKTSFCTRVKVAVGPMGSPAPPPGSVGSSLSLPQPTRSKRSTSECLLILRIARKGNTIGRAHPKYAIICVGCRRRSEKMETLTLIHPQGFPIARYADALTGEAISSQALDQLEHLTSDGGALR